MQITPINLINSGLFFFALNTCFRSNQLTSYFCGVLFCSVLRAVAKPILMSYDKNTDLYESWKWNAGDVF
jgi:hypothetical protein